MSNMWGLSKDRTNIWVKRHASWEEVQRVRMSRGPYTKEERVKRILRSRFG